MYGRHWLSLESILMYTYVVVIHRNTMMTYLEIHNILHIYLYSIVFCWNVGQNKKLDFGPCTNKQFKHSCHVFLWISGDETERTRMKEKNSVSQTHLLWCDQSTNETVLWRQFPVSWCEVEEGAAWITVTKHSKAREQKTSEDFLWQWVRITFISIWR